VPLSCLAGRRREVRITGKASKGVGPSVGTRYNSELGREYVGHSPDECEHYDVVLKVWMNRGQGTSYRLRAIPRAPDRSVRDASFQVYALLKHAFK
jgi:hypothetical protein